MPTNCPDCDIIILNYGIIPGECDTLKHRSLAIEEMYDKVTVSARLHSEVVAEQKAIIDQLADANKRQLALLEKLAGEPRKP